ncbi:hypothetical protein [Epiphyas postvittana nucleopolyhedrovirus]|uniref:Uncharacterized protein n=1 Tax=Epiphyas postvittana nucleopolyhedrovirus TaxID=70600 RepID=Q91GF0_NPVEP|nr:hypothetical protein [Epiphyas postvittana nucleopolyhedrovirus]AAK85668.1 unknown [Epiphyas postvittana nucleopolyhedrovirus]
MSLTANVLYVSNTPQCAASLKKYAVAEQVFCSTGDSLALVLTYDIISDEYLEVLQTMDCDCIGFLSLKMQKIVKAYNKYLEK